jgi:hypothetical protein
MNKRLKNIIVVPINILYKISPKSALKTIYFIKYRETLNVDNPKTYNEKLNWMKLYYRNELMPNCVDKYAVHQFVKDCGCGEILNEILWEGFDTSEIPFDRLPNQFVIKVTHGSGNNIICKDKSKLDKEDTRRKLNKWLKQKYLPGYGEWFYGLIKPRIICEKYLSDKSGKPAMDYKVFCFHGEPKLIQVDIDRFGDHKQNFYDTNWNFKDIKIHTENERNANIPRPENFTNMLEICRKLSKSFPHVRVDLYNIDNKIVFGELTFFHLSGMQKFIDKELEKEMGHWIELPKQLTNNF